MGVGGNEEGTGKPPTPNILFLLYWVLRPLQFFAYVRRDRTVGGNGEGIGKAPTPPISSLCSTGFPSRFNVAHSTRQHELPVFDSIFLSPSLSQTHTPSVCPLLQMISYSYIPMPLSRSPVGRFCNSTFTAQAPRHQRVPAAVGPPPRPRRGPGAGRRKRGAAWPSSAASRASPSARPILSRSLS